ncbi:EAL domain-containing protein [Paenibacillus sp. URB8-2]|uniref:EAL domain-containing protein n=1 Tax=Paenibacillus sp. URB8-2 TaxID=2741301 RepID=UPI0015C14886|nr:EAL domain-containing protein [Paenibacillus sp. URB8-2]BCG58959.1 hypothetical protein PUR_23840 [Paenibacillus sp. URB8-2]
MIKPYISFMEDAAILHYLRHINIKVKREITELRRLSEFLRVMNQEALSTFYQPIVELATGQTMGHEALNRPPVSQLFHSADIFYEFAAKTEYTSRLDRYCRRVSLTRYVGSASVAGFGGSELLFINVSPGILNDERYKSGETVNLLKQLGLTPSRVVLELTERQAVHDYVGFEKTLAHYRKQGFRIAVDDAGSGYNSLKTLVYLKPEFIKLDKSLIRGINGNREQQHLLGLIREYAQASGTRVIAEGIETEAELKFLREAAIDYGQGYLVGRPESSPAAGCIPAIV